MTENFSAEPNSPTNNHIGEFPEQPLEGQVYFTPPMTGRGSDAWQSLDPEQREEQLLRREGVLTGVLNASAREIGEGRYRFEEASKDALTHELTGLANRRALSKRIEEMSPEEQARTAVMFIDLKKFKQVNDMYGHDRGDQVLRSTANALSNLKLRPGDTVVHLSGDEFVVLLDQAQVDTKQEIDDDMIPREEHDPHNVSEGFTERVKTAIREKVKDETGLEIEASVGVVLPEEGVTLKQLLDQADKKMYEDKREIKDSEFVGRVARAFRRIKLFGRETA